MSWELDQIKEREQYQKEMLDDFLSQNEGRVYQSIDFLDYCIRRMGGEGLPAKEPVDLVVTGVYKVPE
jgi:hypothetical protein